MSLLGGVEGGEDGRHFTYSNENSEYTFLAMQWEKQASWKVRLLFFFKGKSYNKHTHQSIYI